MSRAREQLTGLAAGLAMLAVCAALLRADSSGPRWLLWSCALFFGFVTLAVGFASVYERVVGRRVRESPAGGATPLKDGRDYRVALDEEGLRLTTLATGAVRALRWDDLESVALIALDALPFGGISWVLGSKDGTLEVPCGSTGGEALLAAMQRRLPGFDDKAVAEMMGATHGFKQVWTRTSQGR